jgi:eukaryotic-like serine/threonine-protein kinase
MNEPRRCPACSLRLPENRLDGLCPACLWKGLQELEEENPFPRGPRPARWVMQVAGHDILDEIARGGMGIVYRARQLAPSRTVALKMLLPYQLGSADMTERFQLEVQALTELEHPAILPVYDVGEHEELPFFTMKLATGGTLARRKAEYAGNWRAIAELVAKLAGAVHFAHERGVLHRDLKPGNILFDELDHA